MKMYGRLKQKLPIHGTRLSWGGGLNSRSSRFNTSIHWIYNRDLKENCLTKSQEAVLQFVRERKLEKKYKFVNLENSEQIIISLYLDLKNTFLGN